MQSLFYQMHGKKLLWEVTLPEQDKNLAQPSTAGAQSDTSFLQEEPQSLTEMKYL